MAIGDNVSRAIVPDQKKVRRFLKLKRKDAELLNKQTANNREALAAVRECGCFSCGSRFAPSAIKVWEDEELGGKTALCPYCGVDAVVVGTPSLPLSTALLSALYEYWFPEKVEAALAGMPVAPYARSQGDYQRKGCIFQIQQAPEGSTLVGKMRLWPMVGMAATPWGRGEYHPSGVFRVKEVTFVEDGIEFSDIAFVDDAGKVASYEPFGQGGFHKLKEAHEQYGRRLRASFAKPFAETALLFALPEGAGE